LGTLTLKEKQEGTLVLTYAPGNRFLFGGLAVFFALMLLPSGDESFKLSIPVLLLVILCSAAAQWLFQLPPKKIESRTGCYPFLFRKKWDRKEMQAVLFRRSRKLQSPLGNSDGLTGRDSVFTSIFDKGHAAIFISTEAGRDINILTTSIREEGEMLAAASRIAAFLSLPVEEIS